MPGINPQGSKPNGAAELCREVFKVPHWFLLGQSYGGFISFTYLSLFPAAVKGVVTTGGCPPFTAPTVRATYERLIESNAKAFVHETWQHDALRQKGKHVIQLMLPRLMKRAR